MREVSGEHGQTRELNRPGTVVVWRRCFKPFSARGSREGKLERCGLLFIQSICAFWSASGLTVKTYGEPVWADRRSQPTLSDSSR